MAISLGQSHNFLADTPLIHELKWLEIQQEDLSFFPEFISQAESIPKRIKRVDESIDGSVKHLAEQHKLKVIPEPFLSSELVEDIRTVLNSSEKSIAAQVQARIQEVKATLAFLGPPWA